MPSSGVQFLLLAMLLMVGPACAQASEPSFSHLSALQTTEYHRLDSQLLTHSYHLYVRVPDGMDRTGTQRYPVIYLLDGDLTFALLAAYSQYLRLAEEMPEVIIVGIAYGTDDWRQGNRRGTDFTAPAEGVDHYGGAAAFLSMLKQELMPMIEARYPVDPDRRILFGQSLAGQFALFAAQTDSGFFHGLIASNPAIHRNTEFFMRADAPEVSTRRSRLFVSLAEQDLSRFAQPARQWLEFWQAQPSPPFDLKAATLPGHNHFSAAPEACRRGLIWILGVD